MAKIYLIFTSEITIFSFSGVIRLHFIDILAKYYVML